MIEEETQSKLLAQVATPRTDAFLNLMSATSSVMRAAPMAYQNFADFARELERENVKLHEALQDELSALEVWIRAAGTPDEVFDGMQISRDKIKLALANKKL